MAGCYLDAFETVPKALLEHIGEQLQIPVSDLATLRALYRRDRTLRDYQQWVAKILGFQQYILYRQRVLVSAMRNEARQASTLAKLTEFARRWLYDRRILLPAPRSLVEVARAAHLRVLTRFVQYGATPPTGH